MIARALIPSALLAFVASVEAQPRDETAHEVKRLVVPAQLDRLLERLGIGEQRPSRREVTFVDTPELALHERKVVLRVREGGGELEATVKIPAPAQEPLPSGRGIKVEVDVTGAESTRTLSHSASPRGASFSPDEPLACFSAEQLATARKGFGADLPAGLVAFGPTVAERWSVERGAIPGQPDTLRGKLHVERWTLIDGSHIVEVSLRAKAGEVAATVEWLDRLLDGAGVGLESAQSTKTRRALRGRTPDRPGLIGGLQER